MNREQFATAVMTEGEKVNELREEANRRNNPFLAGLIRAAEESLLVVYQTLNDTSIPESEL